MIDLFWSIVLGIVQGITEWFPVSSSGHLALIQNIFGLNAPIIFDIMLHVGSLITIVIIFWSDIVKTLKAFLTFDFKSEYGKLSIYIIIATIVTGVIGIVFKKTIESAFENNLTIGIGLLLTGILLYVSSKFTQASELSSWKSVIMGLMQGIAIFPGISRSGSTISTGLMLGVERTKLIRFSFLLAAPAILGAATIKIKDVSTTGISILPLVVGVIISTLVGYFVLKYTLKLISEKKFHYFAYYCWILGIVVVVLSSIKLI